MFRVSCKTFFCALIDKEEIKNNAKTMLFLIRFLF